MIGNGLIYGDYLPFVKPYTFRDIVCLLHVVQSCDGSWYGQSSYKDFNFILSFHLVVTLNWMAFLLFLFFVPA